MSFDLHITIPESSPEGRVLAAMVSRDHVSPEDAVRKILREAIDQRSPAQRMIGLFSNDEDADLIDSVMELSAESRRTQTTRDIGL